MSLPPGQFSSTSITSTNHHKLHCSGLTHFRTEGAADLVEKGIRLTPELTGSAGWLVAIYGLLGREKEARAALDFYNEGKTSKRRIQNIMYLFPFKDRSVADRFAEGMIKAGMPGRPSGYFPAYQENQLNGKEIESLLFGMTITGPSRTDMEDGRHWWVDRKKTFGLISLSMKGVERMFA